MSFLAPSNPLVLQPATSIMRKTYGVLSLGLLAFMVGLFSDIPLGAMILSHTHSLVYVGLFFVMVYGLDIMIRSTRSEATAMALFLALGLGLGLFASPIVQHATSHSINGMTAVYIAGGLTASIFVTMALLGHVLQFHPRALQSFLMVGGIVLMVGVVIGLFWHTPVLMLALSGGFVLFSSLVITWQVREIVTGGETRPVVAAMTLLMSVYNLFISLLNIGSFLNRE